MKDVVRFASLTLVMACLTGFAMGQNPEREANGSPSNGLVCRYGEESLKGRQLVLNFSGTIKFLEPDNC
jgi:hypothetical protein